MCHLERLCLPNLTNHRFAATAINVLWMPQVGNLTKFNVHVTGLVTTPNNSDNWLIVWPRLHSGRYCESTNRSKTRNRRGLWNLFFKRVGTVGLYIFFFVFFLFCFKIWIIKQSDLSNKWFVCTASGIVSTYLAKKKKMHRPTVSWIHINNTLHLITTLFDLTPRRMDVRYFAGGFLGHGN